MLTETTSDKKNKPQRFEIQWEDDDTNELGQDTSNKQLGEASADDLFRTSEPESFADLLAQESTSGDDELAAGDQVEGQILTYNPKQPDVMIDLGGKNTGILERLELDEASGKTQPKVGDRLKVFVVSVQEDSILVSLSRSKSLTALDSIQEAYDAGIPVSAKVKGVNKGGFELSVLGKPAFCPVSQIDKGFVEDKNSYIGREFDVLIQKIEQGGRQLVVSRSALLERESEAKLQELEASLGEDKMYTGTVQDIRDFGLFVDIDGVEGMVHISEMSHSRVQNPNDLVRLGEQVQVKVLKVETQANGKKRLSLSMKAAAEDPWDNMSFEAGQSCKAKVTRLMEFGAFVELAPGLEGLIHISEMSWEKRIHHPKDLLQPGDWVEARILSIDRLKNRIALTLKHVEDDPWYDVASRFPVGKVCQARIERLKGFGAIAELSPSLTGLIPIGILQKAFGDAYKKHSTPGKTLEVRIARLDLNEKKIALSLPQIDAEDEHESDFRAYLATKTNEKSSTADAPAGPDEPQKPKTQPKDVGSFGSLLQESLNKRSPR